MDSLSNKSKPGTDQHSASNNQGNSMLQQSGKTESNAIEAPTISLPKGGGAIKGIDEKFTVNAVNGTASFAIPLPVAAARGVAPSLALSYNSGAGNGVFGMGWQLQLSGIKRKTDKTLPQYNDGENSDTFLFAEAEDLVPVLQQEPDGSFSKDDNDQYIILENNSPDNNYRIRYYRPRIEGLFARIERWTAINGVDSKWRVISKENITTLLGWTAAARIVDPANANRIFSWMPEFVFDDRGNCTHYIYKPEDAAGFDAALLHHRNRITNGALTYTNLYLEKVLYGNLTPYKQFNDPFLPANEYFFETVFDYGEYNTVSPYNKINNWDFRNDAHSNYKPGFELRTTRLVKRVLLFHRFNGPGEYNGLVKSCDFSYRSIADSGLSFLQSLTIKGYLKKEDGSYSEQSFPPAVFEYQEPEWDDTVKALSLQDLQHAPLGLDEQQYQFTDLYNEGLQGILTEQANGWYYKQNLGDGHFEEAKLVAPKPSFTGLGRQLQLADLDADGGKQLVNYQGEPKGYFELNEEAGWQSFRSFANFPNINMNDPNLRFLDLNGDGKAEALITEDRVFTWYESAGREGFQERHSAFKPFDEETGPAILFADSTQSVFLADMSGDGLVDLVRIRNKEICYWPNLGYGRFGSKIGMGNAPVLDHPEAFNPAYIRLADIDGSGSADLIYLGKNKFSCWKNSCGNAFAASAFEIPAFPAIHNKANITVTDLLGNGVACIVYTGGLPYDAATPVKYIDLMKGKKPWLLTGYKNNLGREVLLSYRPSTYYYVEDKLAGNPWITKLHFPLHCVSRTEVIDHITGHRFVSSYKYHHGYFDHTEQEFRGFGAVEQIDAEHFDHWVKGNASNVVEQSLHQEPVITKSWFHTGASLSRERMMNQFAHEYWYAVMEQNGFDGAHHEIPLEETQIIAAPGVDPALIDQLSAREWQQALRACKGMALRSEVFAEDAPASGATDEQLIKQLTPYSVATHTCVVELLQPQGPNQYAVYIVKEREAVSYHYEREPADPRVAHQLNIALDKYGNVLESASVVYPRRHVNTSLPLETQQAQGKTIISYTSNKYTNDVTGDDMHRLRLLAETQTYELKGVTKTGDYYTIANFKNILPAASDVAYHQIDATPAAGTSQKRLIEHLRNIYSRNDLSGALSLYQLESLAIPFEAYQLAYTPALLQDIFGGKVDTNVLNEGRFAHSEGDENWWMRSGTKQLIAAGETAADAQLRFYMPISFTDPYGAITKVRYYSNYFLLVDRVEDALRNTMRVTDFDFRTMAPRSFIDSNGNLATAISDELGLVKATAKMGKGNEADDLTGFTDFTDAAEKALISNYLTAATSGVLITQAKQLLQHATNRFVYNLHAYIDSGKPAVVSAITREHHYLQNNDSPVQLSFEYSSGSGEVVMKKIQAEPGLAKKVNLLPDNSYTVEDVNDPLQLRWIGNGRAVVNNKGNAVKQYEPYFSVTHQYEEVKELVETGVTAVLYYDAPGRLIKTRFPNGTLARVEFDGWQQRSYDTNDTVKEPECSWYQERIERLIDAELIAAGKDPVKEQEAAEKAGLHASTPSQQHVDTLGRPILSVAHNKDLQTGDPVFLFTKVQLDAEANIRSVTDARNNIVVQYKYDMLGNMVYQKSMDAGQRWLLLNVLGKPLRTWDERDHEFRYFYDLLHRPTQSQVIGGDGSTPLDQIFERVIYGESLLLPDRSNEAAVQIANLLGQKLYHFDTAGRIATPRYDFKGKPISSTRTLCRKYKEGANWTDSNLTADLEADNFTVRVQTDALDRITEQQAPDGSVITLLYNEGGLLNSQTVLHPGAVNAVSYIKDIDYNEKRQREKIIYGNDVLTRYYYDKETFRIRRLETKRQNNDPLQDCYYTFDASGNITHIEDKNVPDVFFDNEKITAIATYTYDALYQLVEATGRENDAPTGFNGSDNWSDNAYLHALNPGSQLMAHNYTQTYRYDLAGNIKEMRHNANGNSWTRLYEYEELNNRLSKTTVGQGVNTFDYLYPCHATHGFITKLPHLEELAWNYKEELVKSVRQRRTDGGTPETTWFQYDGEGRRIRKITELSAAAGVTPGIKEERIYIANYELYKRYNGAEAGLQRRTLSLVDDAHRFAMIETRNAIDDGTEQALVRYQLHNYLGSVALELDATASVISYEEYHPFGTTAYQARNNAIRSAAKRYRYTGMERDEETGLAYHTARYYLPWLGRWLNADPIGLKGGLNVYRYTSNNPIIKTDSSGTDEVTIYHRTTEAGAASMTRAGARTDMSRRHVWAGGGFYGSSSSTIPSSSGASGDVIVAQRVSTEHMADLDAIASRPGIGHNITAGLQDTAEGRAIRSQIYQQMYDQGDTVARTIGRSPDAASVDRVFRDYMSRTMSRVAPNADVLRWRNPDGTFTYVARNADALVGTPTVAGRMTGRTFTPETGRTTTAAPEAPRATTATPDAPHSTGVHAPDAPHGGGGRVTSMVDAAEDVGRTGILARIAGRRVLMMIPVVDVITQQLTYEESAYTGDRPLDAVLNLTIAEVWEVPMAVYSVTELGAHGLMEGGRALSEAGGSALDYAAEEWVAPILGPIDQQLRNLYSGH